MYCIPLEGLDHPNFSALGEEEVLTLFFYFPELNSEEVYQKIQDHWAQVIEGIDWEGLGGEPQIYNDASFQWIQISMTGAPKVKEAFKKILNSFKNFTPELFKVVIVQSQLEQEGNISLRGAEDHRAPEMEEYEDEQAFWEASFNLDLPPPLSEDPRGLFSILTYESGDILREARPMTLFVPGLRIGYGLTSVEYLKEERLSKKIIQSFQEKAKKFFYGESPLLYNSSTETTSTDVIVKDDRIGYAFAMKREDLTTFPPACHLFAEYEVMCILKEIIEEYDLEPVVHWDRSEVFIFNLWEKPSESAKTLPRFSLE